MSEALEQLNKKDATSTDNHLDSNRLTGKDNLLEAYGLVSLFNYYNNCSQKLPNKLFTRLKSQYLEPKGDLNHPQIKYTGLLALVEKSAPSSDMVADIGDRIELFSMEELREAFTLSKGKLEKGNKKKSQFLNTKPSYS